jgi:hypothetical protein
MPQIGESISKTISGGYLNKKFGWDNLLSDLNHLSSVLTVVSDRMKFLKATYGIPTRLGFNRPFCWIPDGTALGYKNISSGPPRWLRSKISSYRYDFRATCWITQLLTHIDDTIGWIRGLSIAFGLSNPTKQLWNIIPLSFVVDWFFQIDQRLDRLLRFSTPGWNVNDISHSVKFSAEMDIDYRVTWSDGFDHSYPLGTIRYTAYGRNVGLPLPQVSLIPSELSPEQLVLLLAILHQSG